MRGVGWNCGAKVVGGKHFNIIIFWLNEPYVATNHENNNREWREVCIGIRLQ